MPKPKKNSTSANATDANATDANATDANATDANATDANVGYEAELWQMADALRGSMDAAEYKHVVLGLIFLKVHFRRLRRTARQARGRAGAGRRSRGPGRVPRRRASCLLGAARGALAPPEGESIIPRDYADWLASLKSHISCARQRATFAVNQELVRLYHHIGTEILERQTRQGWGAKVIDRLAADLREAFPEMKGFSSRNLKYMKFFAQMCPAGLIGQQPAAQLPWFHGISKPIGVAEYQLVRALPEPLDTNLPSIEEIEAELSRLPTGQAGEENER